jgi:hypothetical protein
LLSLAPEVSDDAVVPAVPDCVALSVAGAGIVAALMTAKTPTAPSAAPAMPMVSPRIRRRAPSREYGVGGALRVMTTASASGLSRTCE